MMKAQEHKTDPSISNQAPRPSEASDKQFLVTFSAVISCRLGAVEPIRKAILQEDGRLIFQSVGNSDVYVLRERQVEEILSGQMDDLREIYRKKKRSGVSK